MNNVAFYKEIYTYELSRKKDLDNAVTTPLTIIVLLFGAVFDLYNNLLLIRRLMINEHQHFIMHENYL